MSKKRFSLAELEDGMEFAQYYHLNDFKKKLDLDLANKFELVALKKQVIRHLKTIDPKEDWIPELACSVVKCLQKDRAMMSKEFKQTSCTRKLTLSA